MNIRDEWKRQELVFTWDTTHIYWITMPGMSLCVSDLISLLHHYQEVMGTIDE